MKSRAICLEYWDTYLHLIYNTYFIYDTWYILIKNTNWIGISFLQLLADRILHFNSNEELRGPFN